MITVRGHARLPWCLSACAWDGVVVLFVGPVAGARVCRSACYSAVSFSLGAECVVGCTFLSAVRRRRRVANASTYTNTSLQNVVVRQGARRRLRWRSSQSSTHFGGRRVCPRCATPEIFWCRELCCWMHCCIYLRGVRTTLCICLVLFS